MSPYDVVSNISRALNNGPAARPKALAALRRALRAGASLAPHDAGQAGTTQTCFTLVIDCCS